MMTLLRDQPLHCDDCVAGGLLRVFPPVPGCLLHQRGHAACGRGREPPLAPAVAGGGAPQHAGVQVGPIHQVIAAAVPVS